MPSTAPAAIVLDTFSRHVVGWSTARSPGLADPPGADEGDLEWIEAFYNPVRRHSGLDYLSPVDHLRVHTPTADAA